MLGIIYNPVFAQPRANTHVQLQVIGSNLGFGGSLGYYLSQHWMLGGDVSGMKLSLEKTTHFDKVDHSLTTLQLYGRWYPDFQAALEKWYEKLLSGLYCQAGVAYRNWKFETILKDPNVDGVKAEVKFLSVVPMAGMGFNWILQKGLSFGLGGNFYFGEKPGIDLSRGGLTSPADMISTQADVEKHHYMSGVTLEILAFVGYDF